MLSQYLSINSSILLLAHYFAQLCKIRHEHKGVILIYFVKLKNFPLSAGITVNELYPAEIISMMILC